MRTIIFGLLILFSVPTFAQSGVTAEAQSKIKKERHDAMVEHAKSFLVQKEELEAKLAKVNENLQKLESGIDVPSEFTLSSVAYAPTCGNCCLTWSSSGNLITGR